MENLRREFENFMHDRSLLNECQKDEDSYDYPDYVEAIDSELMPPSRSGVYISRWDLKMVGDAIEASIAMDARARMFKMLMRSVHDKKTMRKLLGAFASLIDAKIEPYRKMMEAYPSSAPIFRDKIEKAERVKKYFDSVLERYFPEG